MKKNSNIGFAKLIAGIVLLLAFAYAKQVQSALQFGLIIVAIIVVGGVLVGSVVWVWQNDSHSGRELPRRSSASDLQPQQSLPRKVDQQFYRELQRLNTPKIEKPPRWSIELIRSLDWKRFEELCAGYFQAKGRKAKVTRLGADGGIDVLLYRTNDPEKILGVVQCKAWTKKPVGVREVRELLGIMTDVGCPLGIYVAISGYSSEARAFAEGKHINLMDAGRLLELIRKLPLETQVELLQQTTSGDYTTPSCPSCGIKLISRTSSKGNHVGQKFWGCRNYPRCRYTMRHAK